MPRSNRLGEARLGDTRLGEKQAAGDFVLSADPGAYAVSGMASTVLADRLLSGDPGAYAVTGAAGSLLVGRALPADPGAYAVTGAAATVVATRLLSADPGAYAVSGAAATVLATRLLVADPGSYAVSGFAAELVYGTVGAYTLVADPGAYSVTGSPATAIAGRLASADPGAYAVSGAAAGALVGRLLVAATGAYAATGFAAELVYAPAAGDFPLIASPGSYAIAGVDAHVFPTGPGAMGRELRTSDRGKALRKQTKVFVTGGAPEGPWRRSLSVLQPPTEMAGLVTVVLHEECLEYLRTMGREVLEQEYRCPGCDAPLVVRLLWAPDAEARARIAEILAAEGVKRGEGVSPSMSREYLSRIAGDYGDTLTFNLKEADGTPTNLSGATAVTFKARREGSTATVVDELAAVSDALNGIVTYIVQTTDFPVAGLYYCQIEVTFAARIVTWDVLVVNVVRKVAAIPP